MKINFAQVPHEDIDMFGEDNLFGPDESGEFYYNFVEYGTNPGGTDEVAIHDGCDRYMPISMDHVPELIQALAECYKIYIGLKHSERIQELVESDTEAYVSDSRIEYAPESFSQTSSWPFTR
jgi:hypothetical protein